jgi:hypothetical protein
MRIVEPGRQQHRPFEHEAIAVPRGTEAIEQPLGRVPREEQIESLTLFTRKRQQASANRSAHVARFA